MKILIALAAVLVALIIGAGIAAEGPVARTDPAASRHVGDEHLLLPSEPEPVRNVEAEEGNVERIARQQPVPSIALSQRRPS